MNVETSHIFGEYVDHVKSQPMDYKSSLKEAWYCHVAILNFSRLLNIVKTAKARPKYFQICSLVGHYEALAFVVRLGVATVT